MGCQLFPLCVPSYAADLNVKKVIKNHQLLTINHTSSRFRVQERRREEAVMKRNNVIYMDDYRRRRKEGTYTLQKIIEDHLAEADSLRRTAEEIRRCLDGNVKYWPERYAENNAEPPQNRRN